MGECKDCKDDCSQEEIKSMPNITININFYDNRVNEDHSNYVDSLTMEDNEGDN